jgi:hypothetical protein
VWTSLVEGVGQRLTESSSLAWLTPATLFWASGFGALYWHDDRIWWRGGLLSLLPNHAAWSHINLQPPTAFFQLSGNEQIALSAAAALVVGLSGLVGRAAAFGVVRVAEGYWPRWLGIVCDWLVRRVERRRAADERRLEALRDRFDGLSPAEIREYADLDLRLEVLTPKYRQLPTRLGNVLRAAESRPGDRYGLDALVCWSRLWLVLPDATKQELTGARNALDEGAIVMFWGILGFLWTAWAWWAAPIALIVIHFAYRAMVRSATVFGDLLVAAFDVHRFALYSSLRWPLPPDPVSEREQGHAVTQYLWRGPEGPTPTFTDDAAS